MLIHNTLISYYAALITALLIFLTAIAGEGSFLFGVFSVRVVTGLFKMPSSSMIFSTASGLTSMLATST